VAPQKQSAPRNDAKPSHSPAREEHARTSPSSGKTYVVKKGDNPVTIAKKLNVAYDDLISLNHIEDPHRLKIGQKLLIPAKATKTKTKKANQ
jgi:LysM repeat protein